MTSENRWQVKIIDKTTQKTTESYRNQTGRQLERLRRAWVSGKRSGKYANTDFHFEAEPNLKRVK